MRTRSPLRFLVLIACSYIIPNLSFAHQFVITRVNARFLPDKTYEIEFDYEMDSLLVGVGPNEMFPEVYEWMTQNLKPQEVTKQLDDIKISLRRNVQIEFDEKEVEPEIIYPDLGKNPYEHPIARLFPGSRVIFLGAIPEDATSFRFKASRIYGPIDFSILSQEGDIAVSELLDRGAFCQPYPINLDAISPPSFWRAAWQYLVLGYEHILPLGLDHILFVIGLFLLSAQLRPLLWQVTAFTLAHSITLGLSIYGVISLSPAIVEPMIAISIAFIAVENICTNKLHPWRPAIVFAFGLLHGLGFAGVLSELGLPRSQFLTALLAFNIGVELGQLSILCISFAAVGWLAKKEWYRQRVVIPASALISILALYWTYERVFG